MAEVMTGTPSTRTARRIWGSLAAEAGTSLIEIVVAAALLGVVTVGVMSSLDVAARVSGNQKGKVVAGNLAEAEMERLRGMSIEQLGTVSSEAPEQRVIDGATYTITRTASWVADTKGSELPCAVTGGNTYMKVRTRVTWGADQKVELDGIIAPGARGVSRTYGALAIRFVNSADGQPIAGVSASLASGAGHTAPPAGLSDANGCIVWSSVPAGTWTMTASKSGWITADEQTTLVRELNVLGADAVFNEYQLFQGARISGSFYSTVSGTNYPSAPEAYIVQGGGQTRELTLPAGATTFQTPWLRADLGTYKVYAGACTESELGATVPATYAQTVPAGTSNVQVRLPSLDVLTQGNGSSDSQTVRVNACQKTYYRVTRGSNPRLGRLDDPGFPYRTGTTTACTDTRGSFLFFFPGATLRRQNTSVSLSSDTSLTLNVQWLPITGIPISPTGYGQC